METSSLYSASAYFLTVGVCIHYQLLPEEASLMMTKHGTNILHLILVTFILMGCWELVLNEWKDGCLCG